MANGRIRIGSIGPAQYSIDAEHGLYTLTGRTANLLASSQLSAPGLAGTIEADEDVTITSIGGSEASFGATGPIIRVYATYENESHNTRISVNNLIGESSFVAGSTGAPFAVEHPDLPFGKGIYAARESTTQAAPQFEVDYDPHTAFELYECRTYYFPIVDYSTSLGTVGQIKTMWHTFDRQWPAGGGNKDVFFGSHTEFSNGSVFSGNNITCCDDVSTPGLKVSTNVWRSGRPLRMNVYMRGYGAAGATSGNSGRYTLVDADSGVVKDTIWNNDVVWWPSGRTPGYNMCAFPGFVDNEWTRTDFPQYQAETYLATGPGCPARIEITDTEDYDSRTKAVLWPVMVQSNWTSTAIVAKVKLGVFYQTGLQGCYIHIFDSTNTHVNGGTGRPIS